MLFELVDKVDLTNIPIDIEVKGAYSKGGIPLNVHGVANVKLLGEEPLLNNAIERFLGRTREQGATAVLVVSDGRALGVLGLADEPRGEAAEAVADLRRLGIERTVMLTGDKGRGARDR